ncbi:MAG: DUF916 and DUF3324 domain-containing protein [Christensenella sp.]|uniref:DUF916 and DUF3324 domain-containing protein n=1 Tax=Christensenella sp. TaxID=1935934 RepID=UPI002B1FCF75|nr:DUF916 and DUF3324 domain-containing protein [Christensenella sp.]MEA5001902.1 DUF916 and DUF3324 domain-containing protein [Christensenella sp.]
MGKKKIRITVLLVVAALLLALIPATVYAADKSEAVGFSVSANLPENQKNSGVSYFDLQMEAKQKQALSVQVFNESTEEIKVKVAAISASTNANGIIDYKTPDVGDETLKTPFSEIAEVKTPELTIPAGKSATAVVGIEMPAEVYDGVILGGIVLTQVKEDEQTSQPSGQQAQQGVYINNEYSYVLGVKLTETDKEVLPAFVGVEAKPELLNYRVNVVHYIRNTEAAIAKNVQLDIEVYSQNEQAVVKTSTKTIDMAPNSVMPYAVMWDGEIAPGKYVSNVSMKLEDKEWKFELPFEVSAQTAQEINKESVEQSQGIPWWVILLIVILVVLILVIVFLLAAMKRRKKKEETVEAGQRMTRSGRRK